MGQLCERRWRRRGADQVIKMVQDLLNIAGNPTLRYPLCTGHTANKAGKCKRLHYELCVFISLVTAEPNFTWGTTWQAKGIVKVSNPDWLQTGATHTPE